MKSPLLRLILLIGVTILLLMAGLASAAERGRPMGRFPSARAQPHPQVSRPDVAREAAAQQEAARARAADAAATHGDGGGALGQPLQRPGHLTPEERKALRRQINDARDVYRTNPPHP